MFSRLSDQLQQTFKNLRGQGRITESNIADALREVRLALLDADVHFQVAKDFIARVKEKALGEAVLKSVTPGQQIIKIFQDELTQLLGGDAAPLNLECFKKSDSRYSARNEERRPGVYSDPRGPEHRSDAAMPAYNSFENALNKPARILMVGLNGAGKTTSSAKLAKWLKTQGQHPMLVALDLVRPAAIEQLVTLGKQIEVPVFAPGLNSTGAANSVVAPVLMPSSINDTLSPSVPSTPRSSSAPANLKAGTTSSSPNVLAVAREALVWCEEQHGNVAIFDTAGRREIDEALVNELRELKEFLKPEEILLVCDGATGQQAVSVAEHFNEALGLTGLILTKLDGDARGGAALSLRSVTGRPIKFVGVGEKLDQWELFHPDRLAGRILGMGDIVSFVEKAAEAIEMDEMMQLEKKFKTASLDLNDFLMQLKMIKRMGSLENLLGMLPGGANLPANMVNGKELTQVEAIIFSMTPHERKRPEILNARRRQRIAHGSGTTVTEVNNLLLRFQQLKKMTKNMGQMKKMLAQFGKRGLNIPSQQHLPNRFPWQ